MPDNIRFCQIVRVLPDCLHYPAKPSLLNYLALPRPPIWENLSILLFIKAQLHFWLYPPQIRIEATFPHEKHGGFRVPWDVCIILHGKIRFTSLQSILLPAPVKCPKHQPLSYLIFHITLSAPDCVKLHLSHGFLRLYPFAAASARLPDCTPEI